MPRLLMDQSFRAAVYVRKVGWNDEENLVETSYVLEHILRIEERRSEMGSTYQIFYPCRG
jgi:hypothetical protein